MGYSDLVDKLHFEGPKFIRETTVESNIAFLPSQVGAVKSIINSLAKEKPDWDIEILDNDDPHHFRIENKYDISVPRKHWDGFMGLFKGKISGNKLNLKQLSGANITEAVDDYNDAVSGAIYTKLIAYARDNESDYKFAPSVKSGDAWQEVYDWLIDNESDKFDQILKDPDSVNDFIGDAIFGLGLADPWQNFDEEEANGFEGRDYDLWKAATGHGEHQYTSDKYESKKVDTVKLLTEAVEDDLAELRKELKVELTKMFHDKEFLDTKRAVDVWKSTFSPATFKTHNVAVACEQEARDIQRIYGALLREYGKDKGGLEMLITAIQERRPLNQFDVFKKYDFLYGSRVQGSYESVTVVLEATNSFIQDWAQSIYVSDPEVLDAVEEEFQSTIKRSKNVLYPKGGSFRPDFFQALRRKIDDVVSGEKKEEPTSKDDNDESK